MLQVGSNSIKSILGSLEKIELSLLFDGNDDENITFAT